MDTPLSGERIAEEKAFAKRYLESLASRKVEYPPDYSSPVDKRPRKVPAINVPVVVPPDYAEEEGAVQDAAITLTVKSARPPLTLSISAHPSDSVTDLKARVAAAPGAPPADAQRLLLKGKVLADAKLLKEYDLADGAVLTLMAKPGAKAAAAPAPSPPAAAAEAAPALAHTRSRSYTAADLPQLTITTDSPGAGPTDVPEYSLSEQPSPALSTAAFHSAIANPDFWQKLHALAQTEFASQDDADYVVDTFLVAMKGRLSATEAAKIRDVVGVAGMGGGV
ncbi:hypothetical protein VHUM_01801 [Vanrija humicola]|uniref:Ubiquitin-like domain-containing protein n=1 Tax=Vanrija humicola TaxID=5417 RepID=A0A7D8V0X2_VANHU|nr:hypothetical protein VHUM_01801 [Vanrija humicola]